MDTNFIGKYEIVSTLGRGSMGVVYKGRDPEIGRLVAIKTLKSMFMGNDPAGNEALQRFRQEARSAGRLHHPNIVTIFEAGRTDNGSPYIAMEYIEGTSLEARIAEQGPLDPLAALHYLAQIASAIDYAHMQNVIHRDIKPSNVLIDGAQRSHLLDFGVAKMSDTSLTPAGTVVGTPSYMSPEQIRGQTLDGRTDIFSLAVVTFEALTGLRPFPGNDFTTVVSNIIHKEPLSFREVGSSLPPEAEKALKWGLAKDRQERCASALEFMASLARAIGQTIDGSGLIGGYDGSKTWSADAKPAQHTLGGSYQGIASLNLGQNWANEKEAAVAPDKPQEIPSAAPAVKSSRPARKAPTLGGSRLRLRQTIYYGLAAGFLAAAALLFLWQPGGLVQFDQANEQEQVVVPAGELAGRDVVAPPPAMDAAPAQTPAAQAENVVRQVPPGGFSPEVVAGLRDDELAVLLRWNGTDSATLRLLAVEAAKRAKPDFLSALLSMLRHQDFVVRAEAAKALAKGSFAQDEQAVQELARALEDPEPAVRGFAARALAVSKNAKARTALEARLQSETSEVVLKVIKDSLVRLRQQG